MTFNYLFADTVVRIKNAQSVKKNYVIVHFSNLIINVLTILVNYGYIDKIRKICIRKNIFMIKVFLKYKGLSLVPVIREFTIVSKPGRRIFFSCKKINCFYEGLGIIVISTSKGVITDSKAKQIKIGGEVLCKIF